MIKRLLTASTDVHQSRHLIENAQQAVDTAQAQSSSSVDQDGNGQAVANPDHDVHHCVDADNELPPSSLWQICEQLKKTIATDEDVTRMMTAFVRENGAFTTALRSHSYRWSELEFYVFDKLDNLGTQLAREKRPLFALHELFRGCEQFLLNAKRYESHHVGTFNYSVRLIQSFAARQWCYHAQQLNPDAKDEYTPLFLYQGASRFRSATSYALQAIEDLEPITNSDVVAFMFQTHDAVRAALGAHADQVMTLRDFEKILGPRAWQGVRKLVADYLNEKLPDMSQAVPRLHALMRLRAAPDLSSGLKKMLMDDKQTEGVLRVMDQGLSAVRKLAMAASPTQTSDGLAALTEAAVKLAGLRPPEDRKKIIIVGEDQRVFALNIFLQSSPDMSAAVQNAVMAYVCTPYVGGEVDQSRAQSVFVAMGERLK